MHFNYKSVIYVYTGPGSCDQRPQTSPTPWMSSTHLLIDDELLVSIKILEDYYSWRIVVMYNNYVCRHPEKSSRPSFHSLCQSLDGEPATLLQWREEDTQCHLQASLLGAELEAGKNLYTELQQLYLQK